MKIDLEKIKSKKTIKELLEFGIINIDKSSGPTSFDVSDFVRGKLNLRKTSHFGTLDPKVTGVLPIALNRACKLTGFFLGEDKEYIGIMRIHEKISLVDIEKAIEEKFTGKIIQIPPVRSRVKRAEREREVKQFKILEIDEQNVLFHVVCEGGTYIRKLVDDLGNFLGVGAHMLELRRIRAGIFKEDSENYPIVNLYDFEKAVGEYHKGKESLLRKIIIPAEIVSEVYLPIQLKKEFVEKVLHGSPIYNSFLVLVDKIKIERNKIVSVFFGEHFIGMFKVLNEGDVFAKPEFVLQEIK